ncbi:MAG TPA: Gfo/Idh/MocA family oxidoreductase [Candidatus Tectomicrobia bacterium]|jgi:phthalate 4,5-cis-dihydrodiol dehydrogenase
MASVAGNGKGVATLRIGIVGLGGGASDMIPAFVQHPHITLTAAADIDPGQLEHFQGEFHGETYLNAEELCQSAQVDVVYIATPNQFHTAHALLALEQGKHVLVEKPMTLTLADADVMIAAAERHGVQLLVNVKHSFDPYICKIRDIVESGELGQLRMLHYWYFSDWLYRPRTAEELNPSLGGGVTWRQGPHQFDIVRTIAGGEVRSVRAMTGMWDASRPVVGCHAAYLEFADGAAATAVYSGYDHFDSRELTFGVGEARPAVQPSAYAQARRTLRQLAGGDAETTLKRAQRYGGARRAAGAAPRRSAGWVLGGPLIVTFDRGDVRLTPNSLMVYSDEDKREIPISRDTDGRHGIVNHLYEAVVNGRPSFADGRWGKATVEVLLAVLASAQEHREVRLSHQVRLLH